MRQQMVLWFLCFFTLPLFAAEENASFVYQTNESFSHYMVRAEGYLKENKQWVNEQDWPRELSAVMPFEMLPDEKNCAGQPKVGILLSHGLSDSPFSMRDPARALQLACYHVRVILLPGHGTRAEDLLTVSRNDWRVTFENAANQFRKKLDALYVGGFSTGGALAAEYAWQHSDEIVGAVLFSPVFKVNSSIDWLAPLLKPFIDWLDHHPSDDFAKYASIPVPAIAEVYKLSKEVRKSMLKKPKELPIFIALSEEDQTVDSSVTEVVFNKAIVGAKSQMVLYSRDHSSKTGRMKVYNSEWPEQKIFGLSHMAVHGSPDNPYYGAKGEYRICGWYLSNESLYQTCRTDPDNWFGEKSDELLEKSPHAARVSWNPDFNSLMKEVTFFMQENVGVVAQ
ncbi:alpha/beta hydrolase [Marinomonas transparens]|uniref:Alpha/beta fold hydrolase n=1 Tax=Marinomonas transparens TaxID=2795388 RepID=A0A934JYI4_9GAMM|nr:alpha/beta fold hydrolase [Marinomonas transparens]MBJ7539509.1 alpha/beta fold hydrolase [Marinomonas transparens]